VPVYHIWDFQVLDNNHCDFVYLLIVVSCFGAVFSIDKEVYEKTVAKSINR